MKTPSEIIDSYITTLRNLINSKVVKYKAPTRKYKSFSEYIKHKLGLSKPDDWDFLCASMDLVEDTNMAIENFIKFKIDGPTKYDETGEKYLRLYGFLNATYIQQNAILTLCEVFRIDNMKINKNKILNTKIRDIRNKLASHSNNFKKKPIFLTRIDLSGTKVSYGYGSRGNYETLDLSVLLQEHLQTIIDILDSVLEKAIGYIYKLNTRLKNEYNDLLNDLREEKKGNIIIKLPRGKKIRIIVKSL